MKQADADYDMAVFGAETEPTVWDACEGGTAVALWTMQGTGHIPAFTESFTPDVLDFLLGHPRISDTEATPRD